MQLFCYKLVTEDGALAIAALRIGRKTLPNLEELILIQAEEGWLKRLLLDHLGSR